MSPFRTRLSFCHPPGRWHDELSRAPGTSREPAPPSPEEDIVVPRHIHQDCRCENVSIALDQMERAAAAGRVVLCRFTAERNKPRALEVKEIDITSNGLPDFCTMSHARIAGLGSTTGNSIPFCRAAAIQSLVDQAEGEGSVPGSHLFWTDTLGVPLGRALGKQSLCKVLDIFSRAKMTLVLDPEMHEHPSTYEEYLDRIRLSARKSRMCRLKEGFVSRKFAIRFIDRMIALDEALQTVGWQSRYPLDVILLKHDPGSCPPGGTLLVPARVLTIMRCFEEDVVAWTRAANPEALPISPKSDKMQLYKLLRLAYLAAPRLCSFVEDDEFAEIIRALGILEQLHAETQDAASHRFRLRRV